MKSDGRNILSSVVSEWEDNVLFDADDPDFAKTSTNATAANLNVLSALSIYGEFYQFMLFYTIYLQRTNILTSPTGHSF